MSDGVGIIHEGKRVDAGNPLPVTIPSNTEIPLPTGAATDATLNDLATLLRVLATQLNSPVWLNVANNALQAYLIGGTTAVTGTLTGVTTVTGLTNIGGYSADQVTFNTSAIQWATAVRSMLT